MEKARIGFQNFITDKARMQQVRMLKFVKEKVCNKKFISKGLCWKSIDFVRDKGRIQRFLCLDRKT